MSRHCKSTRYIHMLKFTSTWVDCTLKGALSVRNTIPGMSRNHTGKPLQFSQLVLISWNFSKNFIQLIKYVFSTTSYQKHFLLIKTIQFSFFRNFILPLMKFPMETSDIYLIPSNIILSLSVNCNNKKRNFVPLHQVPFNTSQKDCVSQHFWEK